MKIIKKQSKKLMFLRIFVFLLISPIFSFFIISCGQKSKDYEEWGGSKFVRKYDNLSYKDEADSASLINEINYDEPTSGTIYQMLVYAFADGNNDGIGDFYGAKEKLGYLSDLGIDQIWLSPSHPASSYHGYDVIDYTKIAPEFGEMKAFDSFLKEAHNRNIRIYMDMVFNHTSYEHPWFQDALKNPSSKYRNYYRFKDSSKNYGDLHSMPVDVVNKYVNLNEKINSSDQYISKFWSGMPDLNLDNEDVINELKNVQKFWIKKGVDGFRYDAFAEFFSSKGETQDNYNVQEIFYELRKSGKEGALEVNRNKKFHQFMIGEWWESIYNASKYFKYSNNKKALDTVYDAKHWKNNWYVYSDVKNMKEIISNYSSKTRLPQWVPFLGNHDEERWINSYRRKIRRINPNNLDSPLDEKDIKALNTALFSMLIRPANPIIFQGDELGYHSTRAKKDSLLREPIKWADDKFNIDFFEKRSGKSERIFLNRSKDRNFAEKQIRNSKEPAYLVKRMNIWRKNNKFISSSDVDTIEKYNKYIDNLVGKGNIFIRKSPDSTVKFLVGFSFEHAISFNIKAKYKILDKILFSKNTIFENSKISLKPNSYFVLKIG